MLSVDDNGSTISIDDGAGSITVDGTVAATQSGTWNIGSITTLPTLANVTTVGTVSSVTAIAGALPAGTNNIGDVDVLSVVPGTGATSLGKAEDAAHSSGDTGVMVLAVRNDAGTALAGTTGDYIPLSTDSSGALRVVGSSGTTQYAEDSVAASGDSGVVMLAVRRDTAASSSGTDGDYSTINTDANGNVRVALSAGGVAGIAEDTASAGAEEGIAILAVRRDSASSGVSADGDFAFLSVTSDGSLRVSGSAGTTQYTEDGASAGGESLVLMGAVRRDTAASSSGTDGDYSTLNTDSSGRLHVNVGNTVTVGSHAVTNAGTFAVQVDGSALTALQLLDNPVIVDDAAFTPATSSVSMAGFQADETATDSVDEGDAGAARMTLDRKQIVTLAPHTQGGPTIFRSLDIDESEEEIKATAGQVYWIHAMNMVATARYLKFYNATAASVTVGTTTPVLTFPIPANSTTGAGFVFNVPQGIPFSTAISVACTTGVADNDTGAPGVNDVIINVGYL